MRLTRVFREYSRVFLLVCMSLLLVVFLVGDVIGRAGRSASLQDVKFGTAFGETVYSSECRAAQDAIRLAGQLNCPTPFVSASNDRDRLVASFLVIEEARRAGVRVTEAQVRELLMRSGANDAGINQLRESTGLSRSAFLDAIGKAAAAWMYAQYQFEASMGETMPQMETQFRDEVQQASVRVSVVNTDAFLQLAPEPTEEQIAAHFEEAKARDDVRTETELTFGYRLPDRVKLEYATVDPTTLQDSIRVSRRQAEEYYERNKDKYKRPGETPSPLALNQNQPPPPVQMSFEEAEAQVKDDIRAEQAVIVAQQSVNRAHSEAVLPWRLAVDAEGNPTRPDPASIVDFNALRERFAPEFTLDVTTTDLLDSVGLARLEGLSRASATIGGSRFPASSYALRVEGLYVPAEGDEAPVLRLLEPTPEVFFDTRGVNERGQAANYQGYFFRVLEVAPSAPPASLDDVRQKVVDNLRYRAAHELAGEQAAALAARAEEVGLEQAVSEADALRRIVRQADAPDAPVDSQPATPGKFERGLNVTTPARFGRRPTQVGGVGVSEALHERVFELASEPASPDKSHRVAVVQMAAAGKWVVVELLEVKPLYRGDFEARLPQLEQGNQYLNQLIFFQNWFAAENVQARAKFEPAPLEG